MKIPQNVRALLQGVLDGNGCSPVETRRAVFDRVASSGSGAAVPQALASYIDKVAQGAYKIADRDIEALRAAGYDDDQIFELTICAAVGAGFARLKRGLAALEEV